MWKLDYKESWVLKNWCFWTLVLEKSLESHLDCKEIQLVHPKGNQFWLFIGRTDAESETPVLWPPDVKNWLIWKDPDSGKDWRQEEKGSTEDEVVRWHHRLNAHEFESTPAVGDGQGGLACCSPWRRKELDMTEWSQHTVEKSSGDEIPDHPTCLVRNLYADQEATVRTGHGTTDWFQIGKGVRQGCVLSPCLFNLHAEYIMRNSGLDETNWNQDCWEK